MMARRLDYSGVAGEERKRKVKIVRAKEAIQNAAHDALPRVVYGHKCAERS